ncbi:MAG: hypothetical protein KIT84_19145 [Labilithrix sp.]|nr:hypothetical protein [Labilithrix sp.]MCW5813152.1 hypothetical protein [Labilithrix sp.]
MRSLALRLSPFLAFVLAACAAESDEAATDEAQLQDLKVYFADAKKLDLSDLTRVAVGFGTEALNDRLSVTAGPVHAGIRFEKPGVFAARAEPSSVLPDSAEVKALDTIVSGLAARFGEKELSTQVNAARLAHLEGTADDYFIESGFAANAGLVPSWSFPAGGLGVNLGFEASTELSSRVIVATKNDGVRSLLSAPLAAMKEMRGFIYPRSVADIRGMKPGEMFALRGQGKLGANFGVGAPIFVAGPVGPLTYSIVVSGGVAGVVSGQIDVQLVRLPGDEVVIDLGVEKGRGVSFRAGIGDQFGIKGICDDGQRCLRAVQVAGQSLDLAQVVEKAIEKQVNKYLTFQVAASSGVSSSRVSLSRFRFHLDRGAPHEVEAALQQLLKFDLRLAQAMYNRDLAQPKPPVTVDFDAVRAATTTTRNFGFEVLGMNVFHKAIVDREGTFVLQTPDGARAILFDHLQREEGWFQRRHAFSRTGVAAESIDATSPTHFKSSANLFIQTVSADKHMDNDFVLDNVDGLLLSLGANEIVDVLDEHGNEIERTLWRKCPVQNDASGDHGGSSTPRWDERCNVRLLDDPSFKAMKTRALAAVEAKLGPYPEDYKKLVRTAADLRLTLQSVGVHGFSATGGPKVAISSDVRFDDQALDTLTAMSKTDYGRALRSYIGMVSSNRRDVRRPQDRDYFAKIVLDRSNGAADRMIERFDVEAQAYQRILQAEKSLPAVLANRPYVAHPVGIRFEVSSGSAGALESVVLRSTSQERAIVATRLYDGLRKEAEGLELGAGLHAEHAALYPLGWLVPVQSLEVAMKVDAEVESTFFNPRQRFIKAGFKSVAASARGADVVTLGAGMFDIRAIATASP